MPARLKVFVTSDGLTDYVVATSSRPKALAAWGAHQDLFKLGSAHETDEPLLVKAATAQPGEVLRRPAGSRAALAKLKPARKPKPAAPSKAALQKVAKLEAELAAEDARRRKALAELDAQRAGLEAKHAKARARLEERLSAARRALELENSTRERG
jgi:hypothetical protein